MRTGTISKEDLDTLKVMLAKKPKQKPKFELNEKVIVHVSERLQRVGIIKEIITAKQSTYEYTKESVDRGWLRPEFLLERVQEADTLYGGPWVYVVEYCDNQRGAKEQHLSHRDIYKYEGLNKTLYG